MSNIKNFYYILIQVWLNFCSFNNIIIVYIIYSVSKYLLTIWNYDVPDDLLTVATGYISHFANTKWVKLPKIPHFSLGAMINHFQYILSYIVYRMVPSCGEIYQI